LISHLHFAISLGRMMTGKMIVQQRGLDIILPPIILPEFGRISRVRFKHDSVIGVASKDPHLGGSQESAR
jgi:hypothetical protein